MILESGKLDIVLLITVYCVICCCGEPRLTISPPQAVLTAPAGKPYGLICSAETSDGTITQMRWINPKEEEIETGTPGVRNYGPSRLKLSFVEPRVEESGTYKCTALYSNTQKLQLQVNLTFYEDIHFEDCDEVQNLVLGREGRISCRPMGNPQPSINWEKDGELVQASSAGILLNTVRQADAGVYTVEAFVPTTGINKYNHITVNVLSPPTINELPEEFLAIQGEEYTIICNAQGSDPLTYSWFDHQLRDLSLLDGFRVEGGRLTIYKVARDAGGEYKCKVANPAGVDEASFNLRVQVRPQIVQLENVTREVGKVAAIECRAKGVPPPSLTIRRDNSFMPLQDGQENRIEVEEVQDGDFRILRLSINNVKRSDDGLYFCKASNVAGDMEKAGHLQVQFQPDMSLTPATTVKAWSGHPANLSCIAEANPNATITWLYQNEPIETVEGKYRIYGGLSFSSLLVQTDSNDRFEVFGMYTCEARNSFGESSINIQLEEATAPGQVTQIVFDKVTSTTITFRLMGPGNTGGLPITHYIMHYKMAGESQDTTLEWIKDAPYIVSRLRPRSKYHFSVSARNMVGEGPWKSAEYVMPEETVPEPPTIITEPETIADYPNRFEVRWEVPNDNGEPITHFAIRYFKVERGIKGWTQMDKAVEQTIRSWEKVPSLELTGLHPDTYYKVEVRASNKIGNSLPEAVVFRTRAGEVNDGHTSKLDDEPVPLPIVLAIVLVAFLFVMVVLDVTCFFRFRCGLLYLMRYKICGRSPEKIQTPLEDVRACVKEVASADNGRIKSDLRSPDQLPPPDKVVLSEEKQKHEADILSFENIQHRPADFIMDQSFKNGSVNGSKTSIGKSSPV